MAGGELQPKKYFLCDLPKSLSLKRLVGIGHGRWYIEQDYQQMKEDLGVTLNGGVGEGDNTHFAIVMHAFLQLEQARGGKQLRWTLPQTRQALRWLLCTWTGVCYCDVQVMPSCGRGP